jgi:hypothetical protein
VRAVLAEWLGVIVPVAHRSSGSSCVEVWFVVVVVFVQVTVEPMAAFTVAGENAKSTMETFTVAALAGSVERNARPQAATLERETLRV